ncbi:hypothetical protein, partial [Botryobacter ruber]|uniref:hypothetical protein n=1 Tax=Botryobacter ruber TaxID=2171629 RepID=UPI0013E29CAB
IPTCHDCNSFDKGFKPFEIETHINPYHEAFDDFYKFEISSVAQLGEPVDKINIIKIGKPLDISLNDIKLIERYSTSLDEVEAFVRYFNDNFKKYIGTEYEGTFIESFFSLKGVPKKRKDILKTSRGKMYRDLLKALDINNIMGIN